MISENVNIIKEKIARICSATGRDPNEIKIIAVSKNTGINSILQAIDSGLNDFGENKAQEITEKIPLISKNINWHFIGHLQRNKVKFLVGNVKYIHSVDSLRLAEEINIQAEKAGVIQKVLLEINTSSEENKYGLTGTKEIMELASFILNTGNMELIGLMTMAPFTDNEKIIRKCFVDLRKLKTILNEKNFKIEELSMGMTQDYQIAIEEGATMIRLGTAIFGERDYSKSWKEL
jgi:PLP dependent protein